MASEGPAFLITNMLQGAVERGTGRVIRKLGFSHPAAGKTGTTNEARDAWFVGYTPLLAAGVWAGFDDNTPLGLTGSAAAAPIWAEFMKCGDGFISFDEFVQPRSVELVTIDQRTGRLADRRSSQNDVIQEYRLKPPSRPRASTSQKPKPRPRRTKSFWDSLWQ